MKNNLIKPILKTNRTEHKLTKIIMIYFGWKFTKTELIKPNQTWTESRK